MKIVAVKHPDSKKIYWFNVPETIKYPINVGHSVLCDTAKGQVKGKVRYVIEQSDGLMTVQVPYGTDTNNVEVNLTPTANIIGRLKKCKVEDIKIKREFKRTPPTLLKLTTHLAEFYATHELPLIEINENGELQDGYVTYLIAKMFDRDLKALIK